MAEELLVNVSVNGDEQFDELDKKINKVGTTTNKTVSEIQKIRKALKDAKSDMLSSEEGTEKYNNALARASSLQLKMKETNDKVRLGIKDFGETAKNISGSIAGLSGGFTATMGVMGLFAGENENLTKAILGVQSALAVTQGLSTFADSIDNMRDLVIGLKSSMSSSKDNIETISNVADDGAKKIDNLSVSTGKGGKTIEDFSKKSVSAGSAITNFISGIGKSLLTMGAFIAIIAAVTYGISKLIEYLNKVPRELEIKLKINEDVFTKMESAYEKLMLFAVKYNSAVKSNNKEQIKALEEQNDKEFHLSKNRLSLIGKNVNAWREAFKDYLKMAEITYQNEAIAKAKGEAMMKQNKAKEDINDINRTARKIITEEDVWKRYLSGRLTLADKMYYQFEKGFSLDGLIKKMSIAQGELADANRDVIETNKMIYQPYPYTDNKTTTKPGPKQNGTKIEQKGNKIELDLEKPYDDDIKLLEEYHEKKFELTKQSDYQLTNEEIEYRAQMSDLGSKFYEEDIFKQLKNEKKMNDARLKDIEIEKKDLEDKKQNAKEAYTIANEKGKAIDLEISKRNVLVRTINNHAQELKNIDKQIVSKKEAFDEANKKSDEGSKKTASILKEEIEALTKKRNLLDSIKKGYEAQVENIDKNISKLTEERDKYAEGSKEYLDIDKQIKDKEIERAELLKKNADNERATWKEKVALVGEYLDALNKLAGGMSTYYQGSMDLTNKDYDAKAWAIEEEVSDSEEKNKKLYQLELERYDALKKDFEMQKKMKEAQAWMDFASGTIGIWSAPGITKLAPFGFILAGIQQAALLATTVGNIKTIQAQTLDKPHKPGGSSSSSASSYNVALNPSQTALTTKEENLNNITNSGRQTNVQNVVKVSEINKVQNKVEVREKNSSY